MATIEEEGGQRRGELADLAGCMVSWCVQSTVQYTVQYHYSTGKTHNQPIMFNAVGYLYL